jgi:hypothetical protein
MVPSFCSVIGRQQFKNTWKVLKCGAEEGLKRSAGLIM